MNIRFAASVLALAALSACGGEAETSETAGDAVAATEEATELDMDAIEADIDSEIDEADALLAEEDGLPDEAPAQVAIRPVRYGFDGPEMDACGGFGQVSGLNPNGDNFLAVRGSPFVGSVELDRLESGQGVYMCEFVDGWVGIVYDKTGVGDCGTGSPIAGTQEYGGACESGWVSERFVTLMAG